MALVKEVWVNQIKENFYPDTSFLTKVLDFSSEVENNKIHIASAGIDPKVLINNKTYPIKIVGRDDKDNEITLDTFETENTVIRRPEVIEYSYDKLESVIRQHRATLQKSVAIKAAHAIAPDADSDYTPLVMTTGGLAGTRHRITFADLLALKERFDEMDMPTDNRYLVLHPKHVTDLLLEDLKIFKDITNIVDGQPLRFAGFGCFSFTNTPTYRVFDGTCEKVEFGNNSTDNFASFAFCGDEVMKADGEIFMYSKENDPEQRATIVGFDKRFICLPIRGRGVGAIVSATSAPLDYEQPEKQEEE
ncbi:MAG: hypothetical protein K2O54_07735 [Prevotella sp.]|nr:hypothetical protein [Prevotella sp.]